jgi:hypothetical protein
MGRRDCEGAASLTLLMKSRVSSGVTSFMMMCSREPPLLPRDALSRMPVSRCPRSISTCVSSGHRSDSLLCGFTPPWEALEKLTSGVNMENTCLPVHRGVYLPGRPLVGFITAGRGRWPFHGVIHSARFIIRSRSMNTSRRVNKREPSRVSCTMPMTGRLDCAVMMRRGTTMFSLASAMAGSVCTACRFISSPSKSAL